MLALLALLFAQAPANPPDALALATSLRSGTDARATTDALVALQATATPAVSRCLREAVGAGEFVWAERLLAVLRELREHAVASWSDVVWCARRNRDQQPSETLVAQFRTAADLALYVRQGNEGPAEQDWRAFSIDLNPSPAECWLHVQRLHVRANFEVDCPATELVRMIQGLDSLVAEAAIDVAAWRGVKASIPALLAVLDRPDPRVFPIGVRLPLRAGAARAILGMASESEPAERARRVLRGEDAAPSETRAAIPARARDRIDTLVASLARADEQAQAIANLVALGANVAPALEAAATAQPSLLAAQGLLAVARALAPSTSAVLPTLVELMCHLPVEQAPDVLSGIAEAGPQSRDVVLLALSMSMHAVHWCDRLLPGPVTGATLDAIHLSSSAAWAAFTVRPDATIDQLVAQLDSRSVEQRLRAIVVLERRGAAARAALPALAVALRAAHPVAHRVHRILGNSARVEPVDLTASVQLQAAAAILAIAAPDDPLVEQARARFAGK